MPLYHGMTDFHEIDFTKIVRVNLYLLLSIEKADNVRDVCSYLLGSAEGSIF